MKYGDGVAGKKPDANGPYAAGIAGPNGAYVTDSLDIFTWVATGAAANEDGSANGALSGAAHGADAGGTTHGAWVNLVLK